MYQEVSDWLFSTQLHITHTIYQKNFQVYLLTIKPCPFLFCLLITTPNYVPSENKFHLNFQTPCLLSFSNVNTCFHKEGTIRLNIEVSVGDARVFHESNLKIESLCSIFQGKSQNFKQSKGSQNLLIGETSQTTLFNYVFTYGFLTPHIVFYIESLFSERDNLSYKMTTYSPFFCALKLLQTSYLLFHLI